MKQNKKDKNLIVEKSTPLIPLSETGISLYGLKLLEMYLSKINSHNPEKLKVRFEKEEIKNILGVDKIEKEVLDKKLDELFTSITIEDRNNSQGLIKMSLFETATAYTDEDGNWSLDLSCTPTAIKYISCINNVGRS